MTTHPATPYKQLAVALALSTIALQAAAHRTWIMPSSSTVEAREAWVTVDAAVSENLFELDTTALKLDDLAITGPDGAAAVLPDVVTGKKRSSFDLRLPQDGTYKIAVINKSVTGSYKTAGGETKRFRGSEADFAKDVPAGAAELRTTYMHGRLETFVTANKISTGALKPSGVGLELVPVTHPTELRTGEQAKWRFTLDGKALPNFAFSLIPGDVRYRGTLGEIRLATNSAGEAQVTLPNAGRYLLSASYPAERAKPAAPGAEAAAAPSTTRRYNYAATLEVLPE